MRDEQVNQYLAEGFNCAQVVFASAAKQLGISEEQARLTAACFGGGMGCGEACGAFTGGLMAIGIKYGNATPGDAEARGLSKEKAEEFRQLFIEEYESVCCRDLLGYDFAKPEEAAIIREKGIVPDFCPRLIAYATEILQEVL